MNDVTVALLIYKSKKYLDFVIESLRRHESSVYNVEYLIVANDATEEVKHCARCYESEDVKVVIHENDNPDDWWIQNVYEAWNVCLKEAETPAVCFVNSDMAFSRGWLDNLMKYDLEKYIPTSWLVESGRLRSLTGLLSRDFGKLIDSFDVGGFERFVADVTCDDYESGVGAYMPSVFLKEVLESVGGWDKNKTVAGKVIPGDNITFGKLADLGFERIMVKDSIVYHFQRGESIESGEQI